MGIIFDVIIVAIILISVYFGYKRGIVDVGFKLFATILSLVISILLYSPITYFIVNNTQIDETIEQIIIQNGIANNETEQSSNNQSSGIETYIQNYAKEITQNAQNAVVQSAAKSISISVVRIGVMIVLYLLTRVILIILKTFTDIITKIPLLKQCNEIAGLAYGILRGMIIIYALLAMLFFIISMSGTEIFNTYIETSYVTKMLYNNNIILKIITLREI